MRDRPYGDKRVFLIDIGRVSKDDKPEPFRSMLGFTFHDAEGFKFGEPSPNAKFESHLPYFKAMPSLANKIVERLEDILKAPPPPPGPVGPAAKPTATVFLAETTDNLDEQREEFEQDLKNHGFRVVPEKRLSSEVATCRQQIEQTLEASGAKIFVQLLEPKLGKHFDGSEETVVTLQHQIARAGK